VRYRKKESIYSIRVFGVHGRDGTAHLEEREIIVHAPLRGQQDGIINADIDIFAYFDGSEMARPVLISRVVR